MSPLMTMNAFIRCVWWAGTFTCGRYLTMGWYIFTPVEGSGDPIYCVVPWTHLNHPQWHLDWFSRFCTAHPCAQCRQRHRHVTCSIRLSLCCSL